MISVYSTNKLRQRLSLNDDDLLPSARSAYVGDAAKVNPNPLSNWHAHLLYIQRRQCLLMVHDASRLALFMACLTKKDFDHLDSLFQDVLMNVLLKAGVSPKAQERAMACLGPLQFNHSINRSVQGTLNRMADEFRFRLEYDGVDVTQLLPYSPSVWLTDRPCTVKGVKGCIWTIKEIEQLLLRTLN